MSAEDFAAMLRDVDLTDPAQQSVAVSIASKIVARPETEPDEDETAEEEEEEDGMFDQGRVIHQILSVNFLGSTYFKYFLLIYLQLRCISKNTTFVCTHLTVDL